MRNNKGFSLIELLGVVTILGILTTIAVLAYSRYIDQSKNKSYKILRESAISATEEYMMEHPGTLSSITFRELVEQEYLENATDPSDRSSECKGEVKVITNDATDTALASNDYEVIICCSNYNHTYYSKTKKDEVNDSCKMS